MTVDNVSTAQPDASPYTDYQATLDRPIGRSDSGTWLSEHLLTIVAVAVALPALRAPVAWVALCAVAAVALLVADAATTQREAERASGSADVVVVPARAVGRVALMFLNPITWLTVLLGAVVAVVVGAVAAGVVSGVRWLAVDGPTGVLAAIRGGTWSHVLDVRRDHRVLLAAPCRRRHRRASPTRAVSSDEAAP